jgi:threonine aldolase
VIDLRSDTVTEPTLEMRRAIADAVVGDEQKSEDPTVAELERRIAELTGQGAAVFLPTATMANQIALRLHGRPGDVLLAEETSHVLVSECGGAAVHAGLVTCGLEGTEGVITARQIQAAAARSTKRTDQRVAVVSLEDTHNNAGGRVWPLDAIEEVVATCRELDVAVHLDGARLLNAAVAQGIEPATIAGRFDTVTVCLTKGLGCPFGALLAGSASLVDRAWREKFLFGGALRQAGIVAAAGVYALDHHVELLADDHARARRLAKLLVEASVPVNIEKVDTNFVQIDLSPLGLGRDEALALLQRAGVGLSATIHPRLIRAVTHLGITDDDIERAAELVALTLRAARVSRAH